MKTIHRGLIAITLGLLLPVFVWAIPAAPHQFYGTVDFETGPAPDGLLVEVKIDDNVVGSTVTSDGRYGDSVFYIEDPDSNRSGKTLRFYVSGIDSGETYAFANFASTELDLIVPGTIGAIEETDENAVIENKTVAVAPTQSTNIKLGTSLNVTVSSGVSTSAVVNRVEKLDSSFFTGATAVIAGNNLLNAYEIDITGDDLTISVTISYDDSNIDENTIKPHRFNGTSWVEISPFTIDKSANTVTFTVSSAETPYAVFGQEQEEETTPPSGGGPTGGGTTPIPQTTHSIADINEDGVINIFDFNLLMVNWGNNPANLAADLDGNGVVDIFDFNLLMVNW
jgi:hypothetical protein